MEVVSYYGTGKRGSPCGIAEPGSVELLPFSPGGRGQAPQQEVGKGVVYLICKIAILEWEKNRSFQGSLFRILQMLSCWRFLVMNVK